MRTLTWTILIGALAAGCTVGNKTPASSLKDGYPAWMYDAPFYRRPSQDLPVLETLYGIPIYHSPSDYFFIRHPAGCQAAGEPRVGIWYSTDHGQVWDRAGFFGVEQSHFLFQGESEHRYWIRFTGPPQETAAPPSPMPHRIYIVDRHRPRVALKVTPSPWEDKGKKLPRQFGTGQNVVLRWLIRDRRLDENSAKLQLCFAESPDEASWLTVPEKIKFSGTMTVEIPEEAARGGELRFRLFTRDLAGNTGTAVSDVLHIISANAKAPTPAPLIRASDTADPIQQIQGARDERPGWPVPGAMLHGRTECVLDWLPAEAGGYNSVNLEFSTNDSQSWFTIARDLRAGAKNKWTVPPVISKNCRLQVVGFSKDGQKYMLVMSPRFTVITVVPDETL